MNGPFRVLFLCSGNSCRSQMAEGFLRQMGAGRVEVKSAGIEAHGLDPRAITVMAEVGVDILEQESTRLTNDMLEWADIVVTLCSHADEHCPVLPPRTRKIHWPLADPGKTTGTDEEITAIYRAVRDEIRMLVGKLLRESVSPPV